MKRPKCQRVSWTIQWFYQTENCDIMIWEHLYCLICKDTTPQRSFNPSIFLKCAIISRRTMSSYSVVQSHVTWMGHVTAHDCAQTRNRCHGSASGYGSPHRAQNQLWLGSKLKMYGCSQNSNEIHEKIKLMFELNQFISAYRPSQIKSAQFKLSLESEF